jgi:FtsP/CotA-like multicopper oxidase with cupredoxin domain
MPCTVGADSVKRCVLVFSRKRLLVDGVYRSAVVVNGAFPGPTITAHEGETVIVLVTNSLGPTELLTVHWHGLRYTAILCVASAL